MLLLLALGLSGCALFLYKPHPAFHQGKIIAHRGASGHAPENTIAAFRLATESHADYFELDCRLTNDDVVVISHDADLEKTTGDKVNIADLTLEELQGYDVGSWFRPDFATERIPTLAQSLEVATKNCGVYVEIKAEAGDGAASDALVQRSKGQDRLNDTLKQELLTLATSADTRSDELARACISEVRSQHMEGRVVIQSFSPLICFIARAEAPEIRTELLLTDDKEDPGHFDRVGAFGMLIGVEGINVSKGSLTPERLKAFHQAGKTAAVYTLNEPAEMERFSAMGVDAIITDFPRECHQHLRR